MALTRTSIRHAAGQCHLQDLAWRLRCRKGDARAIRLRSIWTGYSVSHYKACEVPRRKQITILLAIQQTVAIWTISSRAPWLLSVT